MMSRTTDYNPKVKPNNLLSKSAQNTVIFLTACGVLVFVYIHSTSNSNSLEEPQINASLLPKNEILIQSENSINVPVSVIEPVLPIEEFAPWKAFANHHSSKPFEQFDCPPFPVRGYPKAYSMLNIIENWNPDNTTIPERHYDSLCHFDHSNQTQVQYLYNYRQAEVPFIVYNIPEVNKVVRKWSDPEYLRKLLGWSRYRTETSDTNHFMFWTKARGNFLQTEEGKAWKEPTGTKQVTFSDWLDFAEKNHNKSIEERHHQYFRVSSNGPGELMFKELPFFAPQKSLFIVDPSGQRGIHCRFGMRSVIAEAHFDSGRNVIVLFGGLRRYVLTHPNQCKNMHMLPKKHPSGRHSDVDWSKPDVEKFPNFKKVEGNEVIMTPGNMLYLPQDWIHFIISLNINYQCNTRSGFSPVYQQHIRDCGF